MRTRIKYIDISKCLAMLLVIHNHFNLSYGNDVIKIIIASFHMPLFFIVSGLTNNGDGNLTGIILHVKKRFIYLYFPFLLWSLIYSKFSLGSLAMIAYGSNPSLGSAAGGSWFIPCFIISDILVCLCCYLSRGKIVFSIILSVIYFVSGFRLGLIRPSLGYPFSFDVSLVGAGFIIFGIVAKPVFEKLHKTNILTKFCLFFASFAATNFFAIINKSSYNNELGRSVMALAYYGNYLFFVFSGLLGSISMILLSMIIEHKFNTKFIEKIGKNTFLILFMQQFVIDCFERFICRIPIVCNWGTPIIFSIVVLLICHFGTELIAKVYPNLKGIGVLDCLNK